MHFLFSKIKTLSDFFFLTLQGTVAESLDSSEDDVFETKSYLSSKRKHRYEMPLPVMQTKAKPEQTKKYPNQQNSETLNQNQRTRAMFQNCHNSRNNNNVDINTSSFNLLKNNSMFCDNDEYNSDSLYLSNYSAQDHSLWTTTSSIRPMSKMETNRSDGWLYRTRRDSRDSCSTEGAIIGVDAASQMISQYVCVVKVSRWGETSCPICLCELWEPDNITVALVGCDHCLHLSCLNSMLTTQKSPVVMFIQCPVCQRIYGEKHGNQPPGTMDCCILHWSLPGHPDARTIQITYK